MDTMVAEKGERSGGPQENEALRQVAALCRKGLAMQGEVASQGGSFRCQRNSDGARQGIVTVAGRLTETGLILLHLELARLPATVCVDAHPFFTTLGSLGDKVRLIPPEKDAGPPVSLLAEVSVKAAPLSFGREAGLLEELQRLDTLARYVQAELPALQDDSALEKLYSDIRELAPIPPRRSGVEPVPDDLKHWSQEAAELLHGSVSVAVEARTRVELELALAVLAVTVGRSGGSLAALTVPSLPAREIPQLARKSPGTVVIPAVSINLASNPYEISNDMPAVLAALSGAQRPVLFTGSRTELQTIFHGGQGGESDPLAPAVMHVPAVPLPLLAEFAVRTAAQDGPGLGEAAIGQIATNIANVLGGEIASEQRRRLPTVARRAVKVWQAGRKVDALDSGAFARELGARHETLSGYNSRRRPGRSPAFAEKLIRTITAVDLPDYFREHLVGQDRALGALVSRLRMECLTRPAHQPLRYCAFGTPGTGKSESAMLLAARLGIPYENIDAGGMPDYHTAHSQLLGVGRGIVMSNQPGRLEKAAKHYGGMVVEVSDIDHAPPAVQSALSDLFLQVLETGECQSGTGAVFSCADILFVFTLNLPEGRDEEVRREVGFGPEVGTSLIEQRVETELREIFSGAFMSRIGTPVIFDPLDRGSLALIVERAIFQATLIGAASLGLRIAGVELEAGLGAKILALRQSKVRSFGARVLLEQGRTLVAEALARLDVAAAHGEGKRLSVSTTSGDALTIGIV